MRSNTIAIIIAIITIGFMFTGCGASKNEEPAQPIKLESSPQAVVGSGDARKIVSGQPVEAGISGYWKVAFDAGIVLDGRAYFVALVPKTVPDSLLVYGEEIFVRVVYLHDTPQMFVYLGEPVALHETVHE
jgi:hypothetical protein